MGRPVLDTVAFRTFVTEEALPLVKEYLAAAGVPYEVCTAVEKAPAAAPGERRVIFAINRGAFLHSCPGTPKYVCCGYYVLSPVENCPFRCTYCILNAYFDSDDIMVYANTTDMVAELEQARDRRIVRFGTGEFSDSLFLPGVMFHLGALLEFFGRNPSMFLELKTKSDFIPNQFLERCQENVIFSWSLNSPLITEREEGGTAPLERRLDAARRMAEKGYRLSFHFDPLIRHKGWEDGYARTVDMLFSAVPADRIAWISLGTLRFMPPLKEIALDRYSDTDIFSAEFIRGEDGKKRYFRPLRTAMYKFMRDRIRAHSPNAFVYLCMENTDVWEDVFGAPMTTGRLKELLDERCRG